MEEQPKGKVPTIARRYDASRGRFIVVLKAAKWVPAIMLLSEAPLAYAGPDIRPLRYVGRQRRDIKLPPKNELELANRGEATQNAEEAAATGKQEEVDLTARAKEVETERAERFMKSKATIGRILLAEVVRSEVSSSAPGRISTAYLIRDHFSYKHYFTKDEKIPHSAQLESILEKVAIPCRTLFSDKVTGIGFYPLLGHIRRSDISMEVNAVLLFQHSTASLFLLRQLKSGDEIIIASDAKNETKTSSVIGQSCEKESKEKKSEKKRSAEKASEDKHSTEKASEGQESSPKATDVKGSEEKAPEEWSRSQWLSEARACANSNQHLDALASQWTSKQLRSALESQIKRECEKGDQLLDIVRLNFLSLALHVTHPVPDDAIEDSPARKMLRAAGIRPEDAPALTNDIPAQELSLYRYMKKIGDGRFAMDALLESLRADPEASLWHSLWLGPATTSLGVRWLRAIKSIGASFISS